MTKNGVDTKSLNFFGYGLPIIFTILGIRSVLKHGWNLFPFVLFFVGLFILILALFNRRGLEFVFFKWMRVAHFIGDIVTAIIMSIVFLFIFAPAGIFLRLTGRDLLDRKIDKKTQSYWHKRDDKIYKKSDYLKQF